MLYFRILNSPLADEAFTSQETGIRHEINQLLLAYFGGSYQVNARERKARKLFSPIPLLQNRNKALSLQTVNLNA